MKIPEYIKNLSPIYILMVFIVVIVIISFLYGGIPTKGNEEDYRGVITGVLTFAQFDDGAGSDWYWQNDLVINGSWYHFAEPCYGLMRCHLNQSYSFRYEPYKQLSGDGHWYYWIGKIVEIMDSKGVTIWNYSGEPNVCVYGHWDLQS